MARIGDTFKPGEKVPHSGIYLVTRDPADTEQHEVTCIYRKHFPPCGGCAHPRFKLVRSAQHVEKNEHFKD